MATAVKDKDLAVKDKDLAVKDKDLAVKDKDLAVKAKDVELVALKVENKMLQGFLQVQGPADKQGDSLNGLPNLLSLSRKLLAMSREASTAHLLWSKPSSLPNQDLGRSFSKRQ